VAAGGIYRFELSGADDQPLADPVMTLRDRFANPLGYNDDFGTGLNAQLDYSATASGTIYVEAAGFEGAAGSYRLAATVLQDGADDHPDAIGNNETLPVNSRIAGTLEAPGDADVFRFGADLGATYDLDLQLDTLADSTLAILDVTGNAIAYADDRAAPEDLSSAIAFDPPASGTYYAVVQGYRDLYAGSYSLGLSARGGLGGDDFGETVVTAGAAAPGQAVRGTIESPGDVDWIGVPLVARTPYRLEVKALQSGEGTLGDPVLDVYDPSGRYLFSADDRGSRQYEPLIEYEPRIDGVHYLAIRAFNENDIGSYMLETALA